MIQPPVSRRNPRVRWVRRLQSEPKARREEGVWVVEGSKLAAEALSARLRVRLWVFAQGRVDSRPEVGELLAAAAGQGHEVLLVPDDVFRGLSDTREPQGVLCVVGAPSWTPADVAGGSGPLVALEGLQDPGNLGMLARSAEAAGAAGLLLGPETADPGNPKALRASAGSLLRLPTVAVDDLASEAFARGREVYALTGTGGVVYDQADLARPCLFLVGQEGRGLSPGLLARCSARLTIPMEGSVESLNAATAASVILFEAFRQRRGGAREAQATPGGTCG